MASTYGDLSYFSLGTCFWLLFIFVLTLLTGSKLSLSDVYWAKQISVPSQESNFPARTSRVDPKTVPFSGN